jgi:hypothetical protein
MVSMPVRNPQRRARHRVFVDPARRGEKPRYEIGFARPRGRDDHGEPVECGERREIGRQREDVVGAVVDGEVVARGKERGRALPERGHQLLRHRARRGRTSRKIERQKIAVARDRQGACLLGLESDAARSRHQNAEHDKPRSQRRMPAQIDFGRRSEPAQPVTLPLGHEKRGFRQIVLGGDRLHYIIGQP